MRFPPPPPNYVSYKCFKGLSKNTIGCKNPNIDKREKTISIVSGTVNKRTCLKKKLVHFVCTNFENSSNFSQQMVLQYLNLNHYFKASKFKLLHHFDI